MGKKLSAEEREENAKIKDDKRKAAEEKRVSAAQKKRDSAQKKKDVEDAKENAVAIERQMSEQKSLQTFIKAQNLLRMAYCLNEEAKRDRKHIEDLLGVKGPSMELEGTNAALSRNNAMFAALEVTMSDPTVKFHSRYGVEHDWEKNMKREDAPKRGVITKVRVLNADVPYTCTDTAKKQRGMNSMFSALKGIK